MKYFKEINELMNELRDSLEALKSDMSEGKLSEEDIKDLTTIVLPILLRNIGELQGPAAALVLELNAIGTEFIELKSSLESYLNKGENND